MTLKTLEELYLEYLAELEEQESQEAQAQAEQVQAEAEAQGIAEAETRQDAEGETETEEQAEIQAAQAEAEAEAEAKTQAQVLAEQVQAQMQAQVLAEQVQAQMQAQALAEQAAVTHAPAAEPNPKPAQDKNRLWGMISDALFYTAIVIILLSLMASCVHGGAPRTLLGYSYFTVLTPSMQDEIPQGAFILVHRTDPQKLGIGDNITYMRDQSTSVTHKIINVIENYQGSGVRGFQTKGVNNTAPDNGIVEAQNVVGKVIFVLPFLGAIVAALKTNIFLVVLLFGLFLILSFCLRWLFEARREEKQERSCA